MQGDVEGVVVACVKMNQHTTDASHGTDTPSRLFYSMSASPSIGKGQGQGGTTESSTRSSTRAF